MWYETYRRLYNFWISPVADAFLYLFTVASATDYISQEFFKDELSILQRSFISLSSGVVAALIKFLHSNKYNKGRSMDHIADLDKTIDIEQNNMACSLENLESRLTDLQNAATYLITVNDKKEFIDNDLNFLKKEIDIFKKRHRLLNNDLKKLRDSRSVSYMTFMGISQAILSIYNLNTLLAIFNKSYDFFSENKKPIYIMSPVIFVLFLLVFILDLRKSNKYEKHIRNIPTLKKLIKDIDKFNIDFKEISSVKNIISNIENSLSPERIIFNGIDVLCLSAYHPSSDQQWKTILLAAIAQKDKVTIKTILDSLFSLFIAQARQNSLEKPTDDSNDSNFVSVDNENIYFDEVIVDGFIMVSEQQKAVEGKNKRIYYFLDYINLFFHTLIYLYSTGYFFDNFPLNFPSKISLQVIFSFIAAVSQAIKVNIFHRQINQYGEDFDRLGEALKAFKKKIEKLDEQSVAIKTALAQLITGLIREVSKINLDKNPSSSLTKHSLWKEFKNISKQIHASSELIKTNELQKSEKKFKSEFLTPSSANDEKAPLLLGKLSY